MASYNDKNINIKRYKRGAKCTMCKKKIYIGTAFSTYNKTRCLRCTLKILLLEQESLITNISAIEDLMEEEVA